MLNKLGTEIKDHLFQGNNNLVYVKIPSSIKRIGKNSFQECLSLKQIIFEKDSKLEMIDDYSFSFCASLNQITIPNSVKTIGKCTFEDCISLMELKIEQPSELDSIHYSSFIGCKIFIDEKTNEKFKSLIQNFSDKTFIISSEQNNLIPFYKRIYPDDDETKYKVSLIGKESVGKTQIMDVYDKKSFDENYTPTVGSSIFNVGHLNVWDIAGKSLYYPLLSAFLRKSDIIIIVFDISQRSSFDSLIDFKEYLSEKKDAMFILVGNKCDLDREVSKEEIYEMASKYNLNYFEISAKTNSGIDELFNYANSKINVKYSFKKIENDPMCNEIKNDAPRPNCSKLLI